MKPLLSAAIIASPLWLTVMDLMAAESLLYNEILYFWDEISQILIIPSSSPDKIYF